MMRRHVVGVAASLWLLIAAAVSAPVVLAQQATPSAGTMPPRPEECRVEPVSSDQRRALIQSIRSGEGTPLASPPPGEIVSVLGPIAQPTVLVDRTPVPQGTPPSGPPDPPPFTPPAGQPAEPLVVKEIARTYHELTACQNANDVLRAFALYSDAFLRRGLTRLVDEFGPDDEALVTMLTMPRSPLPPGEWTALVEVRDAQVLADGRVGALVVLAAPPAAHTAGTIYVTFVREGDRWLIDGELRLTGP